MIYKVVGGKKVLVKILEFFASTFKRKLGFVFQFFLLVLPLKCYSFDNYRTMI